MEVMELKPGLWRWTAPHPAWTLDRGRPGGWEQMVGCLYYEPPTGEVTVLIDPQVPPPGSPDETRFWKALDMDVERRGFPVVVLLGNHYHERSAQVVHERYERGVGVSTWARETARRRVACQLTDTFSEPADLPGGIRAFPIEGLDNTETIFYLPPHEALVIADAMIGSDEGQVRIAPVSWTDETPEGEARYREVFRSSLAGLLELPVEMLLVSHGPPILENGRSVLQTALESPAWGE